MRRLINLEFAKELGMKMRENVVVLLLSLVVTVSCGQPERYSEKSTRNSSSPGIPSEVNALWSPRVDIQKRLAGLEHESVQRIVLRSAYVEAPEIDGVREIVFSRADEKREVLNLLRGSVRFGDAQITDWELDPGFFLIESKSGHEVKIKFHYNSVRREMGVSIQRFIQRQSRILAKGLPGQPTELKAERTADPNLQAELDRMDSIGITKFELHRIGDTPKSKHEWTPTHIARQVIDPLTVSGRIKSWKRPQDYALDHRLTLFANDGVAPLVLEYDSDYVFEEWGPHFAEFVAKFGVAANK